MFFFWFQTLDNGMNVIQLETAVGAAIKSFDKAVGMAKTFSVSTFAQHLHYELFTNQK